MGRSRLLVAAVLGLFVSFVVFVALSVLTPDPELVRGEGTLVWERFQFNEEAQTFTAGSTAIVRNEGAVPLQLLIIAPDDSERVLVVSPGGTENLTLDQVGTYRFESERYPWGSGTVEVRSANPFVRFFEDLTDFELRSRRGG